MATKTRAYCFTINNYTQDDIDNLLTIPCKYIVVGKEVGESGTPHLQGFIYFENARSFSAIKKLMPRAHIEIMYSTPQEASTYCKKDNDILIERGECPQEANKINHWLEIKNDIKEGITWDDLAEKYPEYAIKYYTGMMRYYEQFRPKYVTTLPEELYPWQTQLNSMEVTDRQIVWIYDEEGNSGKTTYANYKISQGWKVFSNGKTADIALAWNGENVIFDYSRSQSQHLNYEVLEDIKNGRIFSGKYNSTVKHFKPPIVICFANFLPDVSKLSQDRWLIYQMRSDKTLILLN